MRISDLQLAPMPSKSLYFAILNVMLEFMAEEPPLKTPSEAHSKSPPPELTKRKTFKLKLSIEKAQKSPELATTSLSSANLLSQKALG